MNFFIEENWILIVTNKNILKNLVCDGGAINKLRVVLGEKEIRGERECEDFKNFVVEVQTDFEHIQWTIVIE